MSRKAKQVRYCAWVCSVAAAVGALQMGYYVLEGNAAIAVPLLMPGVAVASAAGWALPRGLRRFGEDHWLYDWRALRARLRRVR